MKLRHKFSIAWALLAFALFLLTLPYAPNRENFSGIGMLMTLLSFPTVIVTGFAIDLLAPEFYPDQIENYYLSLLAIWGIFFIPGWLQWYGIGFWIEKIIQGMKSSGDNNSSPNKKD